ncbi:MAG TPA: hypothetical protein VK140_17330 [Ktedonobacteraceae bacterium]|nr:hypothetical protein [Ktedonobacteraceae bacterium]
MPNPYQELPFSNGKSSQHGERGYPWLFLHIGKSWGIGLLVVLIVSGLCGAFYIWYSRSGYDTTPDSTAGLAYSVIGTIFLVLAAVLYTLRRRVRKRAVGQLNAALNWHVCFAVIGLVVLFMHSFGHFEPISGTYALYSMVVLAISGFVGRTLDHVMPRLIAREVNKVLTAQGDDRIETVSQKLQTIVVHNVQAKQGITTNANVPHSASMPRPTHPAKPAGLPFATNGQSLGASWDLAYISLEPTQQELDHYAPHYRFIPDKKSALNRPEALMPGAEEQLSELHEMHSALQREQFYRYVIRSWRVLHIFLALITIGLVTWHLVFVTMLLWSRYFR